MVGADAPFNYSGKLAFLRLLCVDPRLNRSDLAVASVFVDHANQHTGRMNIVLHIAKIVKDSGIPKSTALRAVRHLEEAGYLAVDRTFGTYSSYMLTGSSTGTGSEHATGITVGAGATVGTGVIQNPTGAIRNLRKGRTGATTGAAPVPPSGHITGEIKATGIEQGRARAKSGSLNAPVIPRADLSEREIEECHRHNIAALGATA